MEKMIKNLKTISLAIVLLFITSSIFANDEKPILKILNAENKTFALITSAASSSELTVRILDTRKVVLHREKISKTNIAKPYSLAQLPSGIYEVELEDNLSIRKVLVKLTAHGLELLEKEERKIFKPFVKTKDQSILFNYLMIGKEYAKVTILDTTGKEIFSSTFRDTPTIHKRFNLSKHQSGDYLVRVETKGHVFQNIVNLR